MLFVRYSILGDVFRNAMYGELQVSKHGLTLCSEKIHWWIPMIRPLQQFSTGLCSAVSATSHLAGRGFCTCFSILPEAHLVYLAR